MRSFILLATLGLLAACTSAGGNVATTAKFDSLPRSCFPSSTDVMQQVTSGLPQESLDGSPNRASGETFGYCAARFQARNGPRAGALSREIALQYLLAKPSEGDTVGDARETFALRASEIEKLRPRDERVADEALSWQQDGRLEGGYVMFRNSNLVVVVQVSGYDWGVDGGRELMDLREARSSAVALASALSVEL